MHLLKIIDWGGANKTNAASASGSSQVKPTRSRCITAGPPVISNVWASQAAAMDSRLTGELPEHLELQPFAIVVRDPQVADYQRRVVSQTQPEARFSNQSAVPFGTLIFLGAIVSQHLSMLRFVAEQSMCILSGRRRQHSRRVAHVVLHTSHW